MKQNPIFPRVLKYTLVVAFFTVIIFVMSIILYAIAEERGGVYTTNYASTKNIYGGEVLQEAPALVKLDEFDELFEDNKLSETIATDSVKNTKLVSTDGKVDIYADYVKKGLSYQPSIKTEFHAKYVLRNTSDTESFVKFFFPLPRYSNEISGVKLIVDGVEIKDFKKEANKVVKKGNTSKTYGSKSSEFIYYDSKIDGEKDMIIEVAYNTVGLSSFSYEGIENPDSTQDFKFALTINGTRRYNIISGLSATSREFGDNSVKLTWDKKALYSTPVIRVSLGDKLNPAKEVSRAYLLMAPIYVFFISFIIFVANKFSKGIRILDVFYLTLLYVVFFPLFNYLASFSIDPTMHAFANVANVPFFTMPLYLAFAIAWLIISGLMLLLIIKINGKKVAFKYILPLLILSLGFFPIVVTVPEYTGLLFMFGAVVFLILGIQIRLGLLKENK